MTATPVLDNPQRQIYEGMSSQSLIKSDFTDPPAAKVTPNLHGVNAGAGSSISGPLITSDNHPGIWNLNTGITAAGRVFILTNNGFITASHTLGFGLTRVGTWISTGVNLSSPSERYTIRAGLFSISLPNVITRGIGFEYDDSQNGGRWQALTHDGAETSIDTGILVAALTWYKLEFQINAAGTSVEFFIDNVSVGTITTNIPSGTALALFYNAHIMKLIGTTTRTIGIDAMYVYQEIVR